MRHKGIEKKFECTNAEASLAGVCRCNGRGSVYKRPANWAARNYMIVKLDQ